MNNKLSVARDSLQTIAVLLDAVGPETSLDPEAWAAISTLDLRSRTGLTHYLRKYVLPEYFGSPEVFRTHYLKCLRELYVNHKDELEGFPMGEYPFLESTPPELFFSILLDEIDMKGDTDANRGK